MTSGPWAGRNSHSLSVPHREGQPHHAHDFDQPGPAQAVLRGKGLCLRKCQIFPAQDPARYSCGDRHMEGARCREQGRLSWDGGEKHLASVGKRATALTWYRIRTWQTQVDDQLDRPSPGALKSQACGGTSLQADRPKAAAAPIVDIDTGFPHAGDTCGLRIVLPLAAQPRPESVCR